MKPKFYFLIASLFISFIAFSQDIKPIGFEFKLPLDITYDADGNLWIADAGSGFNDGQIVRLHADGSKDTIITELPSYFDFASDELKGVVSTRLDNNGNIYVVQGAGIEELSASILTFHIDDYNAKAAPLVLEDRIDVIKVGEWVLANGFAESNPYSFVFDEDGNYIIADAAANAVFKYDIGNQTFSVFAEIPFQDNPTPIGGPFIEPVPTKIIHFQDGYLLSCLTGFPFLDGASKLYALDKDGALSVYAEGLTLVTDIEAAENDGVYIQQFAKFGQVDTTLSFIFGSAQLLHLNNAGELDTILAGYGPSPGFAVGENGTFYMSHLFLGQILEATLSTATIAWADLKPNIQIYPNPTTQNITIEYESQDLNIQKIEILNQQGQIIQNCAFVKQKNSIQIELESTMLSGIYYLKVSSLDQVFSYSFIKQ